MPICVSSVGYSLIKSATFTWTSSVEIGERGIKYDREWLVVEDNMFVAQRQGALPVALPTVVTNVLGKLGLGIAVRTMCQIVPRIEDGHLKVTAPDMPELLVPLQGLVGLEAFVQVWKDNRLPAIDQGDEASEWFTRFLSRERKGEYRLVRMAGSCQRKSNGGQAFQGFHDGFPFMMISEASLRHLNEKLVAKGQQKVPMDRFRPNVVFSGAEPHQEDTFSQIRIGNVLFEGKKLCDRCVVTCTDQKTAERSAEPLRTLAIYRRGSHGGLLSEGANKVYFGRNFDHRNTGIIRVGDLVEVIQSD